MQKVRRERLICMISIWRVVWAAFLGSGAFAATPGAVGDSLLQVAADVPCPFTTPGLVIETVAPESAGFRAGLKPGEQIFSWCRAPGGEGGCVARGDFRTPFDWLDMQQEYVDLGGIVVEGARGTEKLRWNLLPTFQGLTVAPLFHGALAEAYQVSRTRELAGDPASAGEELARAAGLADEKHCAEAALWLRIRAAELSAEARKWPEADAGYQAALEKARALGANRVEVHLEKSWSDQLLRRGAFIQARQRLERALSLEEKDHPEGMGVAALLNRLGGVAEAQENLDEADRSFLRAHALALRYAPGSGAEAAAANNLAVIAFSRGDLEQSERYAARALAIREKLTPSGVAICPSLETYGIVLYARGNYAGAEAAFLRSKKIQEKVDPENHDFGHVLHNLGMLAYFRGDDDAAENLFRRELALYEKLDPSGNLVQESLMGLGEVARQQHRVDLAKDWWQRALSISTKLNPKGPKSTACLLGLAEVAKLQGRNAEAEKLMEQALAIWQEINPEALDTGTLHLDLGVLLLEQGNMEAAEEHLRAANRLCEKHQYRGALSRSYQALAWLLAKKGQSAEAAVAYRAAIDALETQRTHLGGARESQWLYGTFMGDLYFEAAEHEIALHRPQEAWKLIERGRARGFQELLAQRDLRFAGELPTALYAERHRLAAEYDRAQAALSDWVPERGSGEREKLEGRLRDLRLDQADVQERIQRASPRVGALESPVAIDLAAARSALDPGTVLLTYAIGESRSYLFVIEAEGAAGPGLSFYPLAIGRKELKEEVEAFRSLLGRPETLLLAARTRVVKQRGRHLYDLLVRPAEPALSKADRWLISPDGPLHALPFAALLAGDHYLAELKPMHTVASAAVYKGIKATPRPEKPSAATMELLAVGDPLYPAGLAGHAETAADPQVQLAARRGLKLERLPATRGEVESLSKLFPNVRLLLGRDATEDTVKILAPKARRLHFACHGLLDERFPLNSGLAFSIPEHPQEGRDNGFLQAWEIFEELRLDADLVTLSTCDSGRGKELGGEGLVGLVRAFQFAGARSVVASLWSVSDASTALLMKLFYAYLHQGKTKDEALRAAQMELIRGPIKVKDEQGKEIEIDASAPYYWAAFQIYGDWQ